MSAQIEISRINGTTVWVVAHAMRYRVAIITSATPAKAVNKFIDLCKENADVLLSLHIEQESKRAWNFDHPGEGKDWPEFKARDKIVKRLRREAGIIDS